MYKLWRKRNLTYEIIQEICGGGGQGTSTFLPVDFFAKSESRLGSNSDIL